MITLFVPGLYSIELSPTEYVNFMQCWHAANNIRAHIKQVYPNSEGIMAGGDSPAMTTPESSREILSALVSQYPDIIRAVSSGYAPLEQAKLASSKETSPDYAELNAQLFQKYGPELAKTGEDIIRQNALAQANTDLDVVSGPGRQLVQEALKTQQMADPEYYGTRAAAGNQLTNLLNSINVNGLTPAERENTSREVNRQNINRGNLTNPSATSTVENAMQFGDALSKKRSELSDILGTAAGVMPTLKSGTDVFQVATGRPSTTNLGDTKFTGVQQPSETASSLASGFLGNLTGLQQSAMDVNSKQRDSLDRIMEGFSTFAPDCCFIFMEAYNGPLPIYVRLARDLYYSVYPESAIGYKRMAKLVVPLMKYSNLVRKLVNKFMIYPLTRYAGWMFSSSDYKDGFHYNKYAKFWIAFWRILGKI